MSKIDFTSADSRRPTEEPPKVRMATCAYNCKSTRPSSEREQLAFFRELPERETDEYYCGCQGWD